MRKLIGAMVVVLLVLTGTAAAVYHNGAARFALSVALPLTTGYHIQINDLHLGRRHGALVGVQITRGGQPVLDARRIDVYYDLHQLLPGSKHRFGLLAITIDRPHITIIHHENGTYNISIPRAVSGGTRAAAPNNVPIDFTVRVRDASAELRDVHRYYSESRRQQVDHINVDMAIDTATRTTYKATGDLEDTGPQPFRIAGTIDYARGYAIHHVQVKAIPIKAISNYFINSPSSRVVGGTVRDFTMRAWAFGVGPGSPAAYHLAGSGYLADGSMAVHVLDSPIEHINAALNVFDGGFTVQHASASVGHIPIVFSGGIFDFSNPQFRLGVDARGDLKYLKDVAHFAKGLPIYGGVHIHALIEGAIGDPILQIGYSGKQFNYGGVPIQDPAGNVALYKNELIVLPFHGIYDGIRLHVHGLLTLGDKVESTLTLHAVAPSARLPYLAGLVSNQPIDTEALLKGTDTLFDARGYILATANANNVNGFFNINRYGVGTFGPIEIHSGNGSMVAGFSLDRPHGGSAFWASLHDMPMHQPVPVVLPGVNIPQLPPIDAHVVEANLAGTGSGRNVVIGGRAYLSPARIAGVPFDTIAARFAGPFAASRISSVHADGPWGTFDGNGTFAPNLIVARGNYAGTFAGLHMFLGGFPVSGSISGPMAIAIAQGKIFIQAHDAQLRNATMAGIPISAVSGTMAYDNGIMRVYAAQARAAGDFATQPTNQPTHLALATTQLSAQAALHAFGVPLSGGTLRAVGTISPGSTVPDVRAGAVVQNASAMGYAPFSGSAEIAIANDRLHLAHTLGSLDTTYALLSGDIGALASGRPTYEVAADVPVANIVDLTKYAPFNTYYAQGSASANVQIGGAGLRPHLRGAITVPVGSVNGLGFSDARAQIAAGRAGISVQHGSVEVAGTRATLDATLGKSALAVAIDAPHANLSDFNDFFNTGDTLAGDGPVRFSFSHFAHFTFTSGDIDVRALRYRSFPIGDTKAQWTSVRNIAQGHIDVGGEHGRLTAGGAIAFAPSAQLATLITRSRYNLTGTLRDLDLTTWLPALGFGQLPVTGRVDAHAQLRGSYPHLAISGEAQMRGGTIGPLPIETAQLQARTIPGDRIEITSMSAQLPALSASGSGFFGLRARAPLQLQVHAVTDDLPRIIALLSKQRVPVQGHIESTLSLSGTFAAPHITAGVDASNLDVYGVKIPSFVGQVQVHRKSVVVRNAEITLSKGLLTIAGSLPLQLQPFTFGPAGAPIAMDVSANGVDLASFGPLMGNGTSLAGLLDGHVGVSGTVGNPRIFGSLSASNGAYRSALETVPISRIAAQMSFLGTRANLDRLHAQLGQGVVDASGALSFGQGLRGGPLGYTMTIRARGAQIAVPKFGSGTFDADLDLARTPGALAQLRGHASLSDSVISFGSLLALGGSAPGGGPSALPFNLGFDLGITAGRGVHVRSGGAGIFGLDISGEGHAQLTGTLAHPVMAGLFNSAGGTLTLIDRAFRVQEGRVSFNPANGALPEIFAVATTRVLNPDPNPERNPTGATDITARVTGIVPNVHIAFTSSPGIYTNQQIIALLLPLSGLVPLQFTDTGVILPSSGLAGVPGPGTGAPLPNIFERRENGTITIGQEAFSLLNAQFAAGLFAPLENALGNTLGLSDVNLTFDYTGNVGVSLRRPLGANIYALYGTTFAVPVRQTYGLVFQPNAFTSAQFTMFFQQGPTPLFLQPGLTISNNTRLTAGQAVEGNSGFTFLFQRLF